MILLGFCWKGKIRGPEPQMPIGIRGPEPQMPIGIRGPEFSLFHFPFSISASAGNNGVRGASGGFFREGGKKWRLSEVFGEDFPKNGASAD